MSIAWPLVLLITAVHQPPDAIRVFDVMTSCFGERYERYEWMRERDVYVRGQAKISAADVETIRQQIAGCLEDPADPLERVGFTPATLASHREAVIDLIAPSSWRDEQGKARALPPELAPLFSYERLAPHVRDHLNSRSWTDTTSHACFVELPGAPAMQLHSRGLVPWMLPWRITAGNKSWEVADPIISSSILKLIDPDGPCVHLIDGREYWERDFWQDHLFWGIYVAGELAASLAALETVGTHGFSAFDERFAITESSVQASAMQPVSAFVRIATRQPALVDSAAWWNGIENGATTRTWDDFVRVFDDLSSVVAPHQWIAEWKAAGDYRTVEAQIVGTTPHSETTIDAPAQRAWDHAGLKGKPEVEVQFRRADQWCGTIYLALGEPRALIETAHAGKGAHWFDAQEFSAHARAMPPAYGLVDAEGCFESRALSD